MATPNQGPAGAHAAGAHAGTVAHAAGGPGGHGGGEFPPFNTATYPGQLVWLALTFGFLYYMMAKSIAPRLGAIIDTRRRAIAEDLAAAGRARDEANEAAAAYEASLAQARAGAQAIAQETRNGLQAEADARRKSVEAELAAKLTEADSAIRARRDAAMANVGTIATEAAAAIVERLTGRAPDPAALQRAAPAPTA